jgi:two-component system, LytTR family, response regulator
MKCLIVDDERIARQELRRLLAAHPVVEIAGEARNGEEALALMDRIVPDLLFLDIHMPGMNAFELLEKLDEIPQTIFTTAYDSYALRAFDVGAADYLVKPISSERLATALERLKPANSSPRLDRVFVKDNHRCWLIQVSDIYLFESEGNYTRLYFGQERPLILRSLAALQARLDPAVFFRADRRRMINLKWVHGIEQNATHGLVVTLKNGWKVALSRRRSIEFREILSL